MSILVAPRPRHNAGRHIQGDDRCSENTERGFRCKRPWCAIHGQARRIDKRNALTAHVPPPGLYDHLYFVGETRLVLKPNDFGEVRKRFLDQLAATNDVLAYLWITEHADGSPHLNLFLRLRQHHEPVFGTAYQPQTSHAGNKTDWHALLKRAWTIALDAIGHSDPSTPTITVQWVETAAGVARRGHRANHRAGWSDLEYVVGYCLKTDWVLPARLCPPKVPGQRWRLCGQSAGWKYQPPAATPAPAPKPTPKPLWTHRLACLRSLAPIPTPTRLANPCAPFMQHARAIDTPRATVDAALGRAARPPPASRLSGATPAAAEVHMGC